MNIFKIFKDLNNEFNKEIKETQKNQETAHKKFEDSLNQVEEAINKGKRRIKNK